METKLSPPALRDEIKKIRASMLKGEEDLLGTVNSWFRNYHENSLTLFEELCRIVSALDYFSNERQPDNVSSGVSTQPNLKPSDVHRTSTSMKKVTHLEQLFSPMDEEECGRLDNITVRRRNTCPTRVSNDSSDDEEAEKDPSEQQHDQDHSMEDIAGQLMVDKMEAKDDDDDDNATQPSECPVTPRKSVTSSVPSVFRTPPPTRLTRAQTTQNKVPNSAKITKSTSSPAKDEFGDGWSIPRHYRSPTMEKFEQLITPNTKRLSTTMDCSSMFHEYLLKRHERKKIRELVKNNETEPADQQSSMHVPNTHNRAMRLIQEAQEEKDNKVVETRNNMRNEILDTECAYVRSLEVAIRVFLRPLRVVAKQRELGITAKQVENIFLNIEIIALLHQQFLKKLLAAKDSNLFREFGENVDFLKIYTDYASKFDTHTQHTLQQLQSNKKFQSFLAKQQAENDKWQCRGRTLLDLLIMPIQRIPKYCVLLSGIKKMTPESHDEYEAVCSATDKVQSIALHINENKRHVENMSAIFQIQSRMKNLDRQLIQPHRRFVKRALLKVIFPKQKEFEFILFNDILIWAKQNKFAGFMELEHVKVTTRSPNDDPLMLTLKYAKGSAYDTLSPQLLIIKATDEATAMDWARELEKNIQCCVIAGKENAASHRKKMSVAQDIAWFKLAPQVAGATPTTDGSTSKQSTPLKQIQN